jgi:hypothetical protein
VGSELFHAHGQTERHNEANSRFRYFPNAPKKRGGGGGILEKEFVASNASDYGRVLAFVNTLPDQLDNRQLLKEDNSSQNCLVLCSSIPVRSSNNLTYLLTYLLHGAESFLRTNWFCS